MEFTCRRCNGTGTYLDGTCALCEGDGKIDLLDDEAMSHLTVATQNKLTGIIANEILTKLDAQDVELADIKDKVNDVMDKCNDILENVSE